jgi:hypothetical protein
MRHDEVIAKIGKIWQGCLARIGKADFAGRRRLR